MKKSVITESQIITPFTASSSPHARCILVQATYAVAKGSLRNICNQDT
ncbi:hypothetical protein [Pedobacter sp. L105]|nr:hypothetical protein [Pedobacter sp. L105]